MFCCIDQFYFLSSRKARKRVRRASAVIHKTEQWNFIMVNSVVSKKCARMVERVQMELNPNLRFLDRYHIGMNRLRWGIGVGRNQQSFF